MQSRQYLQLRIPVVFPAKMGCVNTSFRPSSWLLAHFRSQISLRLSRLDLPLKGSTSQRSERKTSLLSALLMIQSIHRAKLSQVTRLPDTSDSPLFPRNFQGAPSTPRKPQEVTHCAISYRLPQLKVFSMPSRCWYNPQSFYAIFDQLQYGDTRAYGWALHCI